MGQGHDGGAGIRAGGGHRHIGPILDDAFTRKPRLCGKGRARVDDLDIIARQSRHRQQRLRDMHGPDHQQPQGRVVDSDEFIAFEPGLIGAEPGREAGVIAVQQPSRTGLDVDAIGHRVTCRTGIDQSLQHGHRQDPANRFHQNPDAPAAGKPDGKGIGIGDTKFQHLRAAGFQRLHRLDHNRPFDAAARNRAFHVAGTRYCQLTADRARGRAPGFHHRRQHRPLALAVPVKRGLGDLVVALCHSECGFRCQETNGARADLR